MPDEENAVTKAEKVTADKAAEEAEAKAEEEREEAELDAIDMDIPVARHIKVQGAALTIRNSRVVIDVEIKPAMSTARKRHNEPELRRLGELQSQNEEIMRRLLREYPEARVLLAEWAKEDKPETV